MKIDSYCFSKQKVDFAKSIGTFFILQKQKSTVTFSKVPGTVTFFGDEKSKVGVPFTAPGSFYGSRSLKEFSKDFHENIEAKNICCQS